MPLIMFDMDGTLIDTHGLIAEHMAAAFVAAGLSAPSAADVRQIIGLSLPVAIGQLARSDDTEAIDRLVESYKSLYLASLERHSNREPLFSGAHEALDRLRAIQGYRLGIATGKALAGLTRILDLHGLTGYFDTLQTPDHNPSKPHPGMLLRAMAETGTTPDQVVMIGDTVFDIELAKAAGVMSIGVGWGYHERRDLLHAGADILVDAFDDLDAAIVQALELADA